jgi:hypothetical protein
VGIKEVKRERGGTQPASKYSYIFSTEEGMIIMNWVQVSLCIRESCQLLRGRWCDIIVLKVHVPTEDRIDDLKGGFCV